MIIIDCEQGSEEWRKVKLGIPSASNFSKIIAKKGAEWVQSKSRTLYMRKLAAERITGVSEEGYTNAAIEAGNDTEAEARAYYALIRGISVQQVGFCFEDGKKYGCSPDGLVGEVGGLEIKCGIGSTQITRLIEGVLPSEYFHQVQGSLLVTGRKWWDFIAYHPKIKPIVIRVERDEVFIDALRFELKLFCAELDKLTERIKNG